VWDINQMLSPKPHDFISTSRFFVKEGMLVLWDDRKRCKVKRYCFLFNDLFLFTIPKKKGKKFQLLIYMTLRTPSVSVESVDNSSYNSEFRLHARRKSFIFFAETPEDRKYWVKAVEASIKGTHPEEQHTKAVHQQAKDIAKIPVNEPMTDEDCEITIYSSGSGEGSDEDIPPPAPVQTSSSTKRKKDKSQPASTPEPAATTINFSTANPFASSAAGAAFTTSNPFMTGVPVPTPGMYSAPFATTTPNPFLTTPATPILAPSLLGQPVGQVTTTYTTTVVSGSGMNPFATASNPFATAGTVGLTATPPAGISTANPFATNTSNPFLTYQG